MDFNPFDDIADAAGDAAGALRRKKRQLVKYVSKKAGVGQNAPIRGTGNRQPKYYTRSKKTPFRRP